MDPQRRFIPTGTRPTQGKFAAALRLVETREEREQAEHDAKRQGLHPEDWEALVGYTRPGLSRAERRAQARLYRLRGDGKPKGSQ